MFFVFGCQKTPSPKALKVRGVFHATTHDPVLGDHATKIQQATQQKGFASTAAMIRHAVDQELSSGDDVEQRIAATLDRTQGDLSRMQRVQQTLFAFVDTLAKALLTGLPEQSPASGAKGNERYERFLKSAAATMLNSSHPVLRHGVEQ